MLTQEILSSTLLNLDGRGYKAYLEIKGRYQFADFALIVDRVQGDPFASPSQLRIRVPHATARFPTSLYRSRSREVALRDYLARQFRQRALQKSDRRGTGKSGLIGIAPVGQEILARTAVLIDDQGIEVRFVAGLPARGRRILGRQAAEMLCADLPDLVRETLKYDALKGSEIKQHVEIAEDADWLRQQLPERGLVAFIPNGAVLPRRSGADDRPLQEQAVPFQSPASLQVKFSCPNRGPVAGMGIPAGITLIVGGGYHGKSTVLRSLEVGVYNHVPGDGRELVVTNPAAVKIRAEDGRSIAGVNISPFINHLPQGRSTVCFSTTNASGSTSQAANIMEALEAGVQVLLVDEDTSATNFTIRDRRMQELIGKEKEPITPFIDKVRQLYEEYGVSSILVMGGSGDYFDVADTAIAMDNFQPLEVTEKAKQIARQYLSDRLPEGGQQFGTITPRIPLPDSIDPSRGRRAVKVKVRDVDEVAFGTEEIDLAAVEQLVEVGQLRAIAAAIVTAKERYLDGKTALPAILEQTMAEIAERGLDAIAEPDRGDLAQFRRFELAAVLNRLRSLQVQLATVE